MSERIEQRSIQPLVSAGSSASNPELSIGPDSPPDDMLRAALAIFTGAYRPSNLGNAGKDMLTRHQDTVDIIAGEVVTSGVELGPEKS